MKKGNIMMENDKVNTICEEIKNFNDKDMGKVCNVVMEWIEKKQPYSLQDKLFDFVKKYDPAHILNILENEQPKNVAIILTHIETEKAAILLQNLSYELQLIVVKEIAYLEYVKPEILLNIGKDLENKLLAINKGYLSMNTKNIADILALADPLTTKQILEHLENNDTVLAEKIKIYINQI